MRPDEFEELGVDRRPDRVARLGSRGRAARRLVGIDRVAHAGHVLDRDDDLEVELFPRAGVDDLDVPAGAAEEGADGLERSLGCREADPLRITAGEVTEPFEAEGEMRA